jgi:hypothetical protein
VVLVITAAVHEGGFAEACVAFCVSVFTIIPILLEFSRQVRYFLLFLNYDRFSRLVLFFWVFLTNNFLQMIEGNLA